MAESDEDDQPGVPLDRVTRIANYLCVYGREQAQICLRRPSTARPKTKINAETAAALWQRACRAPQDHPKNALVRKTSLSIPLTWYVPRLGMVEFVQKASIKMVDWTSWCAAADWCPTVFGWGTEAQRTCAQAAWDDWVATMHSWAAAVPGAMLDQLHVAAVGHHVALPISCQDRTSWSVHRALQGRPILAKWLTIFVPWINTTASPFCLEWVAINPCPAVQAERAWRRNNVNCSKIRFELPLPVQDAL